jgi:hypothetical protein
MNSANVIARPQRIAPAMLRIRRMRSKATYGGEPAGWATSASLVVPFARLPVRAGLYYPVGVEKTP